MIKLLLYATVAASLSLPVWAQDTNSLGAAAPSIAPPASTKLKLLAPGAPILFFKDSEQGDDVFDDALANLGLAGDVTFTNNAGTFGGALDDQAWGCVIALQQNSGSTGSFAAQLAAYVGGGGRAIFADWTVDFSGQAALYNAFEMAGTGNLNQQPINSDGNPIWAGVPAVINLFNPGWGRWSFGLAPLGAGVGTGTFPNGDAAAVIGNGGATLFLGNLSDTYSVQADGIQIAENEITEICFPEIEADIDIKFCSDPNAFNCKSKGVLPVTIFGAASFDVSNVDVSTLRLCRDDTGACTAGGPTDSSIDDRGDPTSDLGASMCAIDPATGEELHTLNPDGFWDLDAAFDTREVQDILGVFCEGPKNGVSPTLVIEGETFGGTPIFSTPIGNAGIDQLVKKNR